VAYILIRVYYSQSLGVGGEVGGEENIKEILVKCRYGNNSISFSLLSLLKNVAVDPTRANAPENQARYVIILCTSNLSCPSYGKYWD
jgi:hypothetical protein